MSEMSPKSAGKQNGFRDTMVSNYSANSSYGASKGREKESESCMNGGILGNLYDLVRRRDLFGRPVSLNYKGDESFKTIPGALLTLFVIFLMIMYACDRVNILK